MERLTDTCLRWIPVAERLPEEHDSIFAKLKGTEKWEKGMCASVSDNVLVTIKHENGGLGICQVAKTIDGKWKKQFSQSDQQCKSNSLDAISRTV